jgi:hypothetical protein
MENLNETQKTQFEELNDFYKSISKTVKDDLEIAKTILKKALEIDDWLIKVVQQTMEKENIRVWFEDDEIKAEHIKKRYTDEEKVWFNLKKEFDENLWSAKKLKKDLIQYGKEFDKRFEDETGKNIFEWIKENKDQWKEQNKFYSPFTSLAEKAKGKKPKSKNVKKDIALRHNLAGERGFGYGMLMASQKIELGFEIEKDVKTYRALWIADILAQKILRQGVEGKEDFEKLKTREDILNRIEELEELEKIDTEEFHRTVSKTWLTNYEIRQKLNKDLKADDIESLVNDLTDMPITGKYFYLHEYTGEWLPVKERDSFCRLRTFPTGRRNTNTGEPEIMYVFLFNKLAGLAFLKNLKAGYFDLFPPKFYELKPSSQLIVRALCWSTNSTNIGLNQLASIANITTKHKGMKKRRLEDALRELRLNHFIGKYECYKRGNEYRFKINKVSKLPIGKNV